MWVRPNGNPCNVIMLVTIIDDLLTRLQCKEVQVFLIVFS